LTFQVFTKSIDKDMVVLLAARASRIENQDAIDGAVVGMLADPKEVNSSFLSTGSSLGAIATPVCKTIPDLRIWKKGCKSFSIWLWNQA
jgi:hypothetical protein